MNDTSNNWVSRWSKTTAVIITLITAVASLASLTWDFSKFVNSQLERDKAARIAQLTTYSTFGDMLKRYQEIAKLTYEFLDKYREDPLDQSKLDLLLAKYKTGSAIFYSSPELGDFSEIREFYEELGTLIRFGAIDFDLAFQVVTFPTDFLEETKALADFIGDNWFGANRRLPSFMLNMRLLAENYENKRNKKPVQFDPP